MNQRKEPTGLEKHVQSILLSVISAATIGAFAFLWNLNATIATIRSENLERTDKIGTLQNGMNDVRADLKEVKGQVYDARERLVRIEATKQPK